MKNKLLFATFALLAFAFSASAQQNTLTGTTLSADVTDSATRIVVASVTGITASSSTTSTFVYIDNELLPVISISGTTLTVSRGSEGTRAAAHTSGTVVYAGKPSWFYAFPPQGKCSNSGASAILVTPYINVSTGQQYICGQGGFWVPGFGNPGNSGVHTGLTSTVTAATATPISGPLFKLTGSTTITSFTIPVGGVGQNFCLIPDSTNTVSTGNNIALGSTLVVNKTECYTWDSVAAKYTPSY